MRTLKEKYSEDLGWRIIKEDDNGIPILYDGSPSQYIQKHLIEFENGCSLIQLFSVKDIESEKEKEKRFLQTEIIYNERYAIIEAFFGFEKRFGFISVNHFHGTYVNPKDKSITIGIIKKVTSDLPSYNIIKEDYELGYDDVDFEPNGMLGDVYITEIQLDEDYFLIERFIIKYIDDDILNS